METPDQAELIEHLTDGLTHGHEHGLTHDRHETKMRLVAGVSAAMMIGELVVGFLTHSMALTSDGWHMGTHVAAIGISVAGYWFARTRRNHAGFTFGTGKVHALAAYTSATALAIVAFWMIVESIHRLTDPEVVDFSDALPVAILGVIVNLGCMRVLHTKTPPSKEQHDHHHEGEACGHEHSGAGHDHHHGHHDHGDHNIRAAYVHILADAFTGLLAIVALVCGRYFGWTFLDSIVGVVGGVVIANWSYGLCRIASRQLLDMVPSEEVMSRLRAALESIAGTRVVDLHVWEIGPRTRACAATVVTKGRATTLEYRNALLTTKLVQHLTIEVHRV